MVLSGENSLEGSKEYIKSMGKKAFIVTGKHVVKLDCFKKVEDMLNELSIDYYIFTGITGEPTDLMINDGLECLKSEKCDFIIAIGGGSPLDSMKAIAALYVNGGEISDYMGKTIEGKMLPMVAIPTTAGTGSETTQFTIITDSSKGIKMLLKGSCLVPDLAVIDPMFSIDCPKSVTAATGLDALTHAVESYTSKKSQSLTDTMSLSAIKRIFKYLPVAYNNGSDKKAREEMSIAAFEAGVSINNASVTIVHGMSRPIGANFHVPHGISNAMLLAKCMEFALDGAYKKFAELGRAIESATSEDDDKVAAQKFLNALVYICRVCEVPTLAEYGIKESDFMAVVDKMATDAIASGSPANTIKSVTKQDIIKIYKSLY